MRQSKDYEVRRVTYQGGTHKCTVLPATRDDTHLCMLTPVGGRGRALRGWIDSATLATLPPWHTLDSGARFPLKSFLSRQQQQYLARLDGGEEEGFADEVIGNLVRTLGAARVTYETQTIDDPIVYMHYFLNGSDWWITELDIEDGVSQAFGFACLNGDTDCAELGYISIAELVQSGVELDFHWQEMPLSQVKAKLYR